MMLAAFRCRFMFAFILSAIRAAFAVSRFHAYISFVVFHLLRVTFTRRAMPRRLMLRRSRAYSDIVTLCR